MTNCLNWPYAYPPRKEIARDVLEDALWWRLQWYRDDGVSTYYFEYDEWIHWLLRLVIATSNNYRLQSKWVEVETKLYARRLYCKGYGGIWFNIYETHRLARALNCKAVRSARLDFHVQKPVFSLPVFTKYRRSGEKFARKERIKLGRALKSGKLLIYQQQSYQRDVSLLLSKRSGILRNGELFFTGNLTNISTLAKQRFSWKLEEAILQCKNAVFDHTSFDEIIDSIRPQLEKVLGFDSSSLEYVHHHLTLVQIRADNFDHLLFPRILSSKKDSIEPTRLPPCMALMHKALRHFHHLHHLARTQYSFFLRQIMLPDQGIRLLETEFQKACTYRKRTWSVYEKNFRNSFNSNYYCYGCEKLSTKQRKPNRHNLEFDGCPFAFDSPSILDSLLKEMGASLPSSSSLHLSPQERCYAAFIDIHHPYLQYGNTNFHTTNEETAAAASSQQNKRKKQLESDRHRQRRRTDRISLVYESDDDDDLYGKNNDDCSKKKDTNVSAHHAVSSLPSFFIHSPMDWFHRSCAILPLGGVGR